VKKAIVVVAFWLAFAARADVRDDDPVTEPVVKLSAAGLSAELTRSVAILPALNQTMSDMTEANIGLQKEAKVYLDDQKQKIAAYLAAEKDQTENVLGPKKNPYEAEVKSVNARCGGRALTEAEYGPCASDKERLDAERAEIEAWWSAYFARWRAKNFDPVNAVLQKQLGRIHEIDTQEKKNFAAFIDAQDRSIALRKRIAVLEEIFRVGCSTEPGVDNPFTELEILKWCSSVPWDGASKKLPPLYKYQGVGTTMQ
jgi:hypothetical protein